MNSVLRIAAVTLLLGMGNMLFAQSEEKPVYQITETVNVKHTPVDNQGSSGTCWCFAGIGFVEAEILRMYGKEFNLSEMFVVRNAWSEKWPSLSGCTATTPSAKGVRYVTYCI